MPSSAFQTCALRSEEQTSELQSHDNLVCRLLLEKKKKKREERKECSVVVVRREWQDVASCCFPRQHSLRPPANHASIDTHFVFSFFFFFNHTATTEIYTLSLHDALPINDTATTEIYTLSLHDLFRSRWSPYHFEKESRTLEWLGGSRPPIEGVSRQG